MSHTDSPLELQVTVSPAVDIAAEWFSTHLLAADRAGSRAAASRRNPRARAPALMAGCRAAGGGRRTM